MRAFVRLVAQHLILLSLLVFVCVGVVFRQQIFGLSASPGPQPESLHEPTQRAEPATAPASPSLVARGLQESTAAGPAAEVSAPPIGGAADDAAPTETAPTAQATVSGPLPGESGGVPVPGLPGPEAAPAQITAFQAASATPSQVPQYLSGEPVTASGYSFRPLEQASQAPDETASVAPATQGQPAVQADVAAPAGAALGETTESGGTDTGLVSEPGGPPMPLAAGPAAADPQESTDERLNEARHAFWVGDTGRAQDLYQALVREDEHNPELLGEVGNFYYQTGKKGEAAEAYLTAALSLLEAGRRSEAQGLVETIRSLDPNKAADLAERLGQ